MAGILEAALPGKFGVRQPYRLADRARQGWQRSRLGQSYSARRKELLLSSPAWQRAILNLQGDPLSLPYNTSYYTRFQNQVSRAYASLVDDAFTAYTFFSAALDGGSSPTGRTPAAGSGNAAGGLPPRQNPKTTIPYEEALERVGLYAHSVYNYTRWAKVIITIGWVGGLAIGMGTSILNDTQSTKEAMWLVGTRTGLGLASGVGLWGLLRAGAQGLLAVRFKRVLQAFYGLAKGDQERFYAEARDRATMDHPMYSIPALGENGCYIRPRYENILSKLDREYAGRFTAELEGLTASAQELGIFNDNQSPRARAEAADLVTKLEALLDKIESANMGEAYRERINEVTGIIRGALEMLELTDQLEPMAQIIADFDFSNYSKAAAEQKVAAWKAGAAALAEKILGFSELFAEKEAAKGEIEKHLDAVDAAAKAKLEEIETYFTGKELAAKPANKEAPKAPEKAPEPEEPVEISPAPSALQEKSPAEKQGQEYSVKDTLGDFEEE